MTRNIYFVRHGETLFNKFARLQGWSDTPLTQKGEDEAAKIGRNLRSLKIDRLLSSDMKRAVDTAKILIANSSSLEINQPEQNAIFRECSYGSFEGHSNEEGAIWASSLGGQRFRRISQLENFFGVKKTHDLLKEADPAHLAEDSKELDARVTKIINYLRKLPDNSSVVVVSHGTIIRYIANTFGNQPGDYPSLDNGAFMKLCVTDEHVEVASYNQHTLDNGKGAD